MSTWPLIALIILFFATSVIGVVTGSNSLITVPVMFQFGVPEKEAVATNMFGLVFMAVGATIPFIRKGAVDLRGTLPLVVLTIFSSAIGALLVGVITAQSIKLIVSAAMIVVTIFILVRRRVPTSGVDHLSGDFSKSVIYPSDRKRLKNLPAAAWLLTFVLGIYGGLYSGGYVTILTAVFVAFTNMEFGEAVAATKWINVFSSSVATIIFMWQGLVDYKLGVILGVTMFIGAYAGAHFATRMSELWLRRIFSATVFVLALKTLYDFV